MFLNLEISLQEKAPLEENVDKRSAEEIKLDDLRLVLGKIWAVCKFFLKIWALASIFVNLAFFAYASEILKIKNDNLDLVLLLVWLIPILIFFFILSMYMIIFLQYGIIKLIFQTGLNRKYHYFKSVSSIQYIRLVKFFISLFQNLFGKIKKQLVPSAQK